MKLGILAQGPVKSCVDEVEQANGDEIPADQWVTPMRSFCTAVDDGVADRELYRLRSVARLQIKRPWSLGNIAFDIDAE